MCLDKTFLLGHFMLHFIMFLCTWNYHKASNELSWVRFCKETFRWTIVFFLIPLLRHRTSSESIVSRACTETVIKRPWNNFCNKKHSFRANGPNEVIEINFQTPIWTSKVSSRIERYKRHFVIRCKIYFVIGLRCAWCGTIDSFHLRPM